MLAEFCPYVVPHWIKNHFYAFAAHKLKSRNEIRITCYNDNRADCFAERKTRHIKADSHINPFLAEIQVEVVIGQRPVRPNYLSCGPRLYAPAIWR